MTDEAIAVRRATTEDYAGVAALLSASLAEALTLEERKEGFVQGKFSADVIRWFDESAGVFVACDDGVVVAVLCACNLDEPQLPPQVEALKAQLAEWRLDGDPIPLGRTLCYGPVCIDRSYRRRGLLKRLFVALIASAVARFDRGVAFVSVENSRSLAAHRDGLGMRELGDYDDGAKIVLGFRVQPAQNPAG
jgi:hypothetical protein